ncbi:MAG: hypothetical protein K2X55_26980, partial [Burkholderiaceae bacterium]|nr:hypothetical protein [Burkholderiaceae bacterium]
MDATSMAGQNQSAPARITRRRFVGATVAMAAAPAVNAQQDDVLSVGVARESLAALCADMLALRSWWAHYSDSIR